MKGLGAGGRLWELIERKPQLPFNGRSLICYRSWVDFSPIGHQYFRKRCVILKGITYIFMKAPRYSGNSSEFS